MKLTAILCLLLALVSAALFWQTQQRGRDSARNEELSREVKSSGEVMAELRAISADTRNVLAQLRSSEQQRLAQGEIRREEIRDATKNDTCANAVVPAVVSNSLQHRAAVTSSENGLRARSGKPDGGNSNAAAERPGNVGRNSHLE